MKGVLQSDKRFTAVPSGDREELFRKYVEEIKVRTKVASYWYV